MSDMMTLAEATDRAIKLSSENRKKGFFVYPTATGYEVRTDYTAGWVCRGYNGVAEFPTDFLGIL
jgi:hypothetical protein